MNPNILGTQFSSQLGLRVGLQGYAFKKKDNNNNNSNNDNN
jgi:hypothetical protein